MSTQDARKDDDGARNVGRESIRISFLAASLATRDPAASGKANEPANFKLTHYRNFVGLYEPHRCTMI